MGSPVKQIGSPVSIREARSYFERLVRAMGRRRRSDSLPVMPPPTPEQISALEAACRANGIDVLGPPPQ